MSKILAELIANDPKYNIAKEVEPAGNIQSPEAGTNEDSGRAAESRVLLGSGNNSDIGENCNIASTGQPIDSVGEESN